jgi:hypothetical protein
MKVAFLVLSLIALPVAAQAKTENCNVEEYLPTSHDPAKPSHDLTRVNVYQFDESAKKLQVKTTLVPDVEVSFDWGDVDAGGTWGKTMLVTIKDLTTGAFLYGRSDFFNADSGHEIPLNTLQMGFHRPNNDEVRVTCFDMGK